MATFTLTQTPASKFAYLYPNANGCDIDCFPFGDSPNWECVDDIVNSINPDDTYVYMDGASIVSDTYDVDDHGTLTGTINYVKGCCRAKSDSHPPAHDYVYKIILSRDDDCDEFAKSRNMPLSTGFTTFENAWSENPFTSSSWAWGDLDDLQVGFEASSPSVILDPIVFLPVADGDRTDITGVTTGYEHWEAVRAERPLTEVSEVTDTWRYDLYEYIMASTEYYTENCYYSLKYGDYVIVTDAVNNDTYVYLWFNGKVQYLTKCTTGGGYNIVSSTVSNVFYILKLDYLLVLTYNIAANTLSLTESHEIDAINGSTGQNSIVRDNYLIICTENGAGKSIVSYEINSADGTLTEIDSIDDIAINTLAQDSDYIYANSSTKLKAYTFDSGEFTEVASLDITAGDRGLAIDEDGVLFVTRGTTGFSAYSFDGTDFTLEDTVSDGDYYAKICYANGVIHVGHWDGIAIGGRVSAYTYDAGSLSSAVDTYDSGSEVIRGISISDGFIFTQGDDGAGIVLVFNGVAYDASSRISNGMMDKYLDDNIASVSVVAKMGKEYDAPNEAEIYGRMTIKTHATEYTSDEWKLEYPKKWYAYTWTTNPNTSAAWTLDEVKALQAGIGLKGNGTKYAACNICQLVVTSSSNISPEIQTSQCYLKVNYSPPESSCTLHKPSEISFDHGRNVQILNFWSGNREVYDESRSNKTLVLTGSEYEFDPEFYTAKTEDVVVTGYFDDYDVGETFQWNPERVVDGNENRYSSTMILGDTVLVTAHTLAVIPVGNVAIKVEIRAKLAKNFCDGQTAVMSVTPVFDATEGDAHNTSLTNCPQTWSEWFDITNDTNAPATWTPDDVEDLNVRVKLESSTGSLWVGCAYVAIRVTYCQPEQIDSTPCERIQCIRNMGENGATVSPSGLGWGTGFIDGNYRIKSFGWQHISEKPEVYDWVLELEASE